MSYKRQFDPEIDSLSQMTSTINDCLISCRKLLMCKDAPMEFIRWLDRARQTDGRTTYLFCKAHLHEFSPTCASLCSRLILRGDQMRILTIQKIEKDAKAAGKHFDAAKVYEDMGYMKDMKDKYFKGVSK